MIGIADSSQENPQQQKQEKLFVLRIENKIIGFDLMNKGVHITDFASLYPSIILHHKNDPVEWKITEAEEKFLKGRKHMVKFALGSNGIILYGCPAVMAVRSQLMDAWIEQDNGKPTEGRMEHDKKSNIVLEHTLMALMTPTQRPLITVWLYFNGFNVLPKLETLDLKEYLETFDIAGYFNFDPEYEFINDDWKGNLQSKIQSATKDELIANADMIVKISNKLGYKNIVHNLYTKGIHEILDRLNHVMVLNKHQYYTDIKMIDRKIMSDQKELDEFILNKMGFKKVKDKVYKSHIPERFVGCDDFHDLIIERNAVIMKDRTDKPVESNFGHMNHDLDGDETTFYVPE